MQTNNSPKQNSTSEDNSIELKLFLNRVLGHWKLFIVMSIIALSIANFKNGYDEKSYQIDATITTKEEKNTLFDSNGMGFSVGGPSNEVESITTNLKSRTHNENVVSKLKFYIDYLEEGKYRKEDVYGKTPFEVTTNTTDYQILGEYIQIQFLEGNQVKVSVEFQSIEKNKTLYEYNTHTFSTYNPKKKKYEKTFNVYEEIKTPFATFRLEKKHEFSTSKPYFIRFNSFNGTVKRYQAIRVTSTQRGGSILKISLIGANKNRLVKYINTTIKVLGQVQKDSKIAYAVKTKSYIDNLFKNEAKKLENIEFLLSKFKDSTNLYNIEAEGQRIFTRIASIDEQLLENQRDLDNVLGLRKYLKDHDQTTKAIPAPSVIDIKDPTVQSNSLELITLVTLKNELEDAGVTGIHPEMIDIRNRIDTRKEIVYENLRSLEQKNRADQKLLELQLKNLNRDLKKIPKLEQELVQYSRNYAQTEANFNYLKQKSYEAGSAIAANVSDIRVLDDAKDTGQGSSKPNKQFNYMVSVMLAVILCLFYIIALQLFDNTINSVEEIENMYQIPVIGVVGKNKYDSNLIVLDKPKSSVSESFRALRSNMQFFYKKKTNKNSKTVLFTSSVSGEGKTLISANIATAFALSGKKTIVIGFDMRKPKIHKILNVSNEVGAANYLSDDIEIDAIIKKSTVPMLDVITSGPVPPNPSELLMSDKTQVLIEKLQQEYDYVIIDTPPVGLVTDAIELLKYADVNMYIIRQKYTKKDMMKMMDDKYINGEVKNIGYVINDFETNSKYGYGYGYYSTNSSFSNNYHENDEISFMEKIKKRFLS